MATKTVSQIFVLDLDRTMIGSAVYDLAEDVLQDFLGDRMSELRQSRDETEASGGSFDFIAHLEKLGVSRDDFLGRFADAAREVGIETIRMAGATDLLERLDSQGIPYLIMTYGGEEWQRAKLSAAGYEMIPTIITDTKEKGRLIAKWQDEKRSYSIVLHSNNEVAIVAATVVLVDDKAIAFQGLPSSASGYLLQSVDGKTLRSQQGELPAHVKVIHSLTEVDLR